MLYARWRPAVHSPWLLGLGFAGWLAGVSQMMGHGGLLPGLVAAATGLGLLALGPYLLLCGSWLIVDLKRGWVHWRVLIWPRYEHESFSPHRVETIEIRRRGLRSPALGWWELRLRIDHPRLTEACVARRLSLGKAHAAARAMATAIQVSWHDERGLLHVAMPEKRDRESSWHDKIWLEHLAPPPELEVRELAGGMEVAMPNVSVFQTGKAMNLIYAILWCLWAWSCLLIEVGQFGPMAEWDMARTWTVALLVAGSLVGAVLLSWALAEGLGAQVLTVSMGRWTVWRRWLGMNWRRRPIRMKRKAWVRRVDFPPEESGLWIPDREQDIQIGVGLSSEALAWLQQSLLGPEEEKAIEQDLPMAG